MTRKKSPVVSIIDLLKAEGKARARDEGYAEGFAEGCLIILMEFHQDGTLTTQQTRGYMQRLCDRGLINPGQKASALASLG